MPLNKKKAFLTLTIGDIVSKPFSSSLTVGFNKLVHYVLTSHEDEKED